MCYNNNVNNISNKYEYKINIKGAILMKINFKKMMCAAAAAAIGMTALAGCGSQKHSDKLTYWAGIAMGDGSSDADALPFVQELKKETGVDVEFTIPSNDSGQKTEQFNIMVASTEYNDIVEWNWAGFKGGAQGAIDQGIIRPLNEYMDSGKLPNLKKYLEAHPEVDKLVKTDKGQYYVFPFIRENEKSRIFNGPILRKDWLDDLGLDVPETIDEWENVLLEFKDKKGATAPLTLMSDFWDTGAFMGAYGVKNTFVLNDNNKVEFGPIQDGYKQFLTKMNDWYNKGLLDNGFAQLDSNMLNSQMTSGKSGAAIYSMGGGIGKWLGAMASDAKYDLVGAKFPVLKKGDKAKFGTKAPIYDGQGAAITTSCPEDMVDDALKLLDYAYSDEGRNLFNFGTEGVDWEMVDGKQTYTDHITNNPDGKTMSEMLALDTRATGGPFAQDVRYTEQFMSRPQQQAAVEKWKDTDDEKYSLPPLSYTTEEMEEYTKIMSNVETLEGEKFVKYIQGTESLDTWDSYVTEIEKMGIERATEIVQQAYDRYMSR